MQTECARPGCHRLRCRRAAAGTRGASTPRPWAPQSAWRKSCVWWRATAPAKWTPSGESCG
eukprot:1605236-Prymnesium_polylepis.1